MRQARRTRTRGEPPETARAGDDAIVESESFGASNAVEHALAELGRAGAAPRLLVASANCMPTPARRPSSNVWSAPASGCAYADDSEKLAAAGERAWLGSANATSPFGCGAMTDWGI